jgi:hypothetical protein
MFEMEYYCGDDNQRTSGQIRRLATMFVPGALCDPVQRKSSGLEIRRNLVQFT